MAKSREGRPIEFYLSQIRELEAENKSLRRRLKNLEKKEHIFDDNKDNEEPTELPIGEQNNKQLRCTSCGKGSLEIFEVMGRVFSTCPICGNRVKLK